VSDEPTLIYLETDDEITTVVRRMRVAEPGRVVIVAPGRSRATSSTVALRLLARAAETDGRTISIVGDALTRSLAAEAGLTAYGSVADARRADPAEPPTPSEGRRAAIHVVRGTASDETAPTLTAVAAATRDADTAAVPVARARPSGPVARSRRPQSRRPAPRRRLPLAAAVAAALAILVAWGAIAAIVLPAAAITITPRTEPIGPIEETITVNEVDQASGVVEQTVAVAATGTYDTNTPAAGRVTFFNFSFFDVRVPAESLVATGQEEGDQAYATREAITVPAGEFDPLHGGITAGEASVDVTAAAPGPDGNVEAGTIDTVLDPNLAGQLRGFPSITEPLVTNVDPTSGGATESGPEISQEDVDAAVSELLDALQTAVAAEVAGSEDLLFADAAEPAEPQIEGVDDLVGMRDPESPEIHGSLAYDRLTADPARVDSLATERLAADPGIVPAGWELVSSAVEVRLGEVRREGRHLLVDVTLTGARTPIIDRQTVLQRVIGRSEEDARAALADLGDATVELWPVWVGTVPNSDWRIDLEIGEP
jgi:hypothetical protein